MIYRENAARMTSRMQHLLKHLKYKMIFMQENKTQENGAARILEISPHK